MQLLKSKKQNKKQNKKGGVEVYFILVAALMFAIVFLINMHRMEKNLETVGENTVKIINTFETSERLFFYIDASAEISAKRAEKTVIEKSGYMEKKFKGEVIESGCGLLVFPIIDADKPINECFPEYQDVLKVEFVRQLNYLLLKYAPFEIDVSQINTIVKDNGKAIQISVNSISDMSIPVYSYIESFYRAADKTETNKVDIKTPVKTNAGYWSAKEYLTLVSFRRTDEPTKIVIHDTMTANLEETFAELQTGTYNYNYVIDTNGKVYIFAPENRYTLSSGCKKSGQKHDTCQIENTDTESISIALINKDGNVHKAKQTTALNLLVAEISIRNPNIAIDESSILFNNEIDTSRKDPAPDLDKEAVINVAKSEKDRMIADGTIIWPATSVGNTAAENTYGNEDAGDNEGDNPITGDAIAVTGNAMINIPVNDQRCINNVRTTLYYTPSCEDHAGIWLSGQSPCNNSLGYCCIPMDKRGFYEEVKCQGSGVCNGQVYHSSKIEKTMAASVPLGEYTRGITSTGKDPTPQRTVAADPNCNGFDYGSKLYIYWDADSSWNGYYVVEDTGSAFKNRCDKMDIYAGVGLTALNDAKKGINSTAKICVLDKDFQMPDPNFAGGSTYIDPITGEYNVKYVHTSELEDIKKLFDNSKLLLEEMINSCGTSASSSAKDTCLQNKMKQAETKYGLQSEYCDINAQGVIKDIGTINKELSGALPSAGSAKIAGYVFQVTIDNQDLFQNTFSLPFLPNAGTTGSNTEPQNYVELLDQQGQTTTPEVTPQISTPQSNDPIVIVPQTQDLTQSDVFVTINDGTGIITVKLEGEALQWVEYTNKQSQLYAEGGFLQIGDRIIMNINYLAQEVYADKFNDIASYPEDLEEQEILEIVRKTGDCATTTGNCFCNISPARMLAPLNLTNENGKNHLTYRTSAGDTLVFNLPFEVEQNIYNLTSSAYMKVNISNGKVVLNSAATKECEPKREYKYICSTLSSNPDLGTSKFTLKV